MFSEVLIIQVKLLQSTIREFSSIADKEVVKRIYLKTMQKLLAVTQKATKAENSRDSNSMRIDDSSNDSRLAFFSLYCFVFYLM
jgi:ribosomal RNA-processing protein 12